ncbi:MAG: NADH-quinone oxidoreductase subunit J [Candidatus Marinimicrobia bacterium]|nr:NADH-quinone oxidoreductase subunit J [Candidatus Neomarinimicrobiota bacterium]
MTTMLFYIFAALLIGSALFVVLNRNPMYSVVALVFGFANLAGIYFLLEAYFIGALQVLVYAGAIMVLFLFVVMLLDVKPDKPRRGLVHLDRWWFAILVVLFLGLLLGIVPGAVRLITSVPAGHEADIGNVERVGQALFTSYLLPFEVAALLLTVALIGTVFLAKRKI